MLGKLNYKIVRRIKMTGLTTGGTLGTDLKFDICSYSLCIFWL